ncbi:hypothetical protein RHMOL_Rhmol02G0009700 [Rhododendron molle]|uniref:Uncharacterized protein n=3 Tax=Rhododendron molle TaxID=49168 RepID=A0ACC0PM04_RHOML|nr:hypothetical protein RHMOL_Rhmol13G0259400 [Rhododendron molle]KAI8538054.1 hypothetical protein RHMOL_Rhmol09G0071600 [Rhododendron molle]KAI8566057.1 hypothetical protein RHMOL_Rhmol02G0009700 [Rhododendron molle]
MLDLNVAYLDGGGCGGGVGFTGFIPTALPLFFLDKLSRSEALHNHLNVHRFDRKVSDLRFPVFGVFRSDSGSAIPDPGSAVRGDDVGSSVHLFQIPCRNWVGSWSLTEERK